MKKLALSLGVCVGLLASAPGLADAAARDVTDLRKGTAHRDLYAMALDPSDANAAIAVGGFGTIVTTRDGGESWQNQDYDTERALLSIAVSGERQIVTGQSGLILVRDGSGDWRKIEVPTDARLLGVGVNEAGLAYAVGQFGAVLKSTDGGDSWRMQDLKLSERIEGGYDPHLYDVHVSADGVATIVGEFGLILRADNSAGDDEAGADEDAADESSNESPATTQASDTASGDAAASAGGQTEKTTEAAGAVDASGQWEIISTADESLFSLQMRDDGVGFAVGQSGYIVRTDDGGLTWTRLGTPLEANLLGVWSQPDGTVTIPGFRHMLVSDDNGESWRQMSNDEVNRGWYIDAINIGDKPGVVAIGYSGKIIRVQKKQ